MTIEELRIWAMRQRPHQLVVIDVAEDGQGLPVTLDPDEKIDGYVPPLLRVEEPRNLPA